MKHIPVLIYVNGDSYHNGGHLDKTRLGGAERIDAQDELVMIEKAGSANDDVGIVERKYVDYDDGEVNGKYYGPLGDFFKSICGLCWNCGCFL